MKIKHYFQQQQQQIQQKQKRDKYFILGQPSSKSWEMLVVKKRAKRFLSFLFITVEYLIETLLRL